MTLYEQQADGTFTWKEPGGDVGTVHARESVSGWFTVDVRYPSAGQLRNYAEQHEDGRVRADTIEFRASHFARLAKECARTQHVLTVEGKVMHQCLSNGGSCTWTIDGKYPDDWEFRKRLVFQRDDYICQRCGDDSVEVHCHHITPISDGGNHATVNLETVCKDCHNDEHGFQI